MIVLAIDTAGADCAVALYDSVLGAVLGQWVETIGRGHAERLMEAVDATLAAADLPMSAVERIAVVIGPGSFTGIRVGVATARGFALALSVPVVGVSTLSVIAANAVQQRATGDERPVLAAMDAKRDEVYLQAFFASGEPIGEAMVLSVDEAKAIAAGYPDSELAGSGAGLLAGNTDPRPADRFPIDLVARLGVSSQHPPKPLYLRGPDVRPQQGFAVARA